VVAESEKQFVDLPQESSGAFSRRGFCSTLIGAGVAVVQAPPALAEHVCRDAEAAPAFHSAEAAALGEINRNVAWGTHLEGASIYDAAFIEAIAKEKPKVIAVGSGLKFGNLHPRSIAFEREAEGKKLSTWTEVDDIVRLSSKIGASVRGDAIVWNDWLPAWITDVAREKPKGWRDALHNAFELNFQKIFAHFDELDRQYKSPVMPWCGIVNEPFAFWDVTLGKPAWRAGAWLDAFEFMPDGVPGYIHQAFEYAEKYSRSSRPALYLNEANCDTDKYGSVLRPAMLALVDSLQKAGQKVDAIGLESHLQPQWMDELQNPDWRPFVGFLKELQARGVAVYITELDVNDCSLQDIAQRDRLVAHYTQSFVAAALEVPSVTMVTNWDFADSASWYRADSSPSATFSTLGHWAKCLAHPACPRPTIYDQNLAPKAARDALAKALSVKG
jgi:endo-1,4-beta-xylanase